MEYIDSEEYTGLNLQGRRYVEQVWRDCVFTDCRFSALTLIDCRFRDCTFVRCIVTDMVFSYTQVQDCIFTGCTLLSVHWDQLLSDLNGPISKIQDCTLKYNVFEGMNLRKLSFAGCQLPDCTFHDCDLRDANFRGCSMPGSQLTFCDLRKTDLRNADGWNISINSCKLEGARFTLP